MKKLLIGSGNINYGDQTHLKATSNYISTEKKMKLSGKYRQQSRTEKFQLRALV